MVHKLDQENNVDLMKKCQTRRERVQHTEEGTGNCIAAVRFPEIISMSFDGGTLAIKNQIE